MKAEKPKVGIHKVNDLEKSTDQDQLHLKTKIEFTIALIELMRKVYGLDTNKATTNLEAPPSRRHGA